MKTYLFFDTETTGVPLNYKAHYTDTNNFPRIVQLSWLLYNDLEEEISFSDHIIKPEGFKIPQDVIDIHGISNEIAETKGYELKKVLNKFYTDVNLCDVMIGHNISFDENVVMCEYVRMNAQKYAEKIDTRQKVCTMLSTTKFCDLKNKNNGLKWPKLIELYLKLFGEDFDNQHNALNDVRATARCFFELKRLKIIEI